MTGSTASLVLASLVLMHCTNKVPPPDEGGLDQSSEEEQDGDADSGNALEGGASSDATTDDSAPPAPPACDPNKPFGAPTRIPGTSDTLQQATPRLSADELTIYFTTHSSDNAPYRLAKATRATRNDAFGAPSELAGLTAQNSNDNDPAPSADHLSLWFHSNRGGNTDLYFATRSTLTEDWTAPAMVPGIATGSAEAHAYFRMGGGGELWFVSNRNGNYDIFVAKKNGGSFDSPTTVPELNSGKDDYQPQPSEDGLTILLSSTRDGGKGKADLWIAKRTSTTVPFGAPTPLDTVNSSDTDQAGWISPDGCRLYFSSTRGVGDGHDRLYIAVRPL